MNEAPVTIPSSAIAVTGGGMLQPPSARALTLAQSFQGLIPQSIGEAIQLSDFLAKSEAIPSSLRKNPASVLTVIMTGMEIGLTPLQAVNNIFNIGGNLGMKGNLMLAKVRTSGLMLHWDEGWDDTAADPEDHFGWCEVIRKDEVHARAGVYPWNQEPFAKGDLIVRRKEFSRAMARKVKVKERDEWIPLSNKGTYVEWPERMYPMRARTWLLEMAFGDVLKGLTSLENLEGGQVIDAQIVNQHTETQGDTADAILADIRDHGGDDGIIATSIESGFDLLKLAPARRLQLLTQYRKDPAALVVHLRNEWGKQNGKGDVGTAKADAAKAAALVAEPESTATRITAPNASGQQPDLQSGEAGSTPAGATTDNVDDAMPTTTATPAEDAAMVEQQRAANVPVHDAAAQDAIASDPVKAAAPALSGLARARSLGKRRF